MLEKLLNEIEALVGSDEFEYEIDGIMERFEEAGAGLEAVTPLLQIMERHPLDDFGAPGAVVHFIESFDPDYEPYLLESLRRRPSMHTVWMLNRCINGGSGYLDLMKQIAGDRTLEREIRDEAAGYVEFQEKR